MKIEKNYDVNFYNHNSENYFDEWLKKTKNNNHIDEKFYQDLQHSYVFLSNDKKKDIYKGLISKFREIEFENSNDAWIEKAYILDAIDLFVDKDQFDKLTVAESTYEPDLSKGKLFIPYHNISKIKKVAKDRQEFVTNNAAYLEVEYTKTTKLVKFFSKRNIIINFASSITNRITTKVVGILYNRNVNVKKLAKAARGMGIKSVEVLHEGNKMYYRGPKFLFGRQLHEYATVTDFFIRDWTQQARGAYLKDVDMKELELRKKHGIYSEENQYAISAADARNRIRLIEKGELDRDFELTGKVLNTSAEKKAKKNKDNSTYYSGKYLYNLKNLFGKEKSDTMELDPNVSNVKDETQKIILAQHEILKGMYHLLEEGAVQVVQRLAPADIHNYVLPIDGTPLTHRQAAEELKLLLTQKLVHLEKVDKDFSVEQWQQITYYDNLIKIFEKQEEQLGHPTQTTVDIWGTNQSVAGDA
ncbi:MAG: hypothetical protein Tsb0021_13980 [Chlamydiales bacterium]